MRRLKVLDVLLFISVAMAAAKLSPHSLINSAHLLFQGNVGRSGPPGPAGPPGEGLQGHKVC